MVQELMLSGDANCQGALLYSGSLNAYRVMNPVEGRYFSISISSGTLTESKSYKTTLSSLGITGLPESLTSSVKVEKKEGKTAWILDEPNGLAYVITTNK